MAKTRSEFYNSSGMPDPTAYEAIQKITTEEKELDKKAGFIIKIFKFILSEAGFELLSRIEIKDKKSGKEFK